MGNESKKEIYAHILCDIEDVLNTHMERDEKLRRVCEILREQVRHYNWVGFYLLDENDSKTLILGPFVGEPTEHTRIPFGSGICGQAAELEKTFLVQDVSKQENYLACSIKVKAEIVIPIFKNNRIAGELDIDSHFKAPFSEEDKRFLEKVAKMVAETM